MKRALTTLCCFLACAASSPAAEVYFDTVNTASASRLHGAYIGTFGGGVNAREITTSRRLSHLNMTDDGSGWIVGLEFGYKWATPAGLNLAAELELYYLDQDIIGSRSGQSYRSSLGAFGAMANGIVQQDLETILGPDAGWVGRIKPYVGAGVGFGYGYQNHIVYERPGKRSSYEDNGETSFGYQLLVGVEAELAENFSIYGEYRYLDFYDFGNGDIEGVDFSAWVLGVRFQY